MSDLQYYAYKGVGETNREKYRYSQAVRVGDRVECAGQGGWDPSTGTIPSPTPAQINQAFANVELALRDAGAKRGWAHVFRVTSYHVPRVTPEALEAMVWNFEKYMPDHRPVWTCLGVSGLAEEGMMVEIEVVAHDPAEGGGGKKMI